MSITFNTINSILYGGGTLSVGVPKSMTVGVSSGNKTGVDVGITSRKAWEPLSGFSEALSSVGIDVDAATPDRPSFVLCENPTADQLGAAMALQLPVVYVVTLRIPVGHQKSNVVVYHSEIPRALEIKQIYLNRAGSMVDELSMDPSRFSTNTFNDIIAQVSDEEVAKLSLIGLGENVESKVFVSSGFIRQMFFDYCQVFDEWGIGLS